MNSLDRKYLQLSIKRLGSYLPYDDKTMIEMYETNPYDFSVEAYSDFLYACVFSYPIPDVPARQIILLVYDENDQIVADTNAIHLSVPDFLQSQAVYDYLSEESDWMYLEHYTLSGIMFPDLPYPFCQSGQTTDHTGEVLLYGNAYVSIDNRRQGLFKMMLESMRDHALRYRQGMITLYCVLSMDPDVPCYGPDKSDEPYIYSYQQDEPKRLVNKIIAEHVGLMPIKLEELDPKNVTGTKLWFCVRKETVQIIEYDPK